MKKRFLSFLLILCMLLSMVPVAAQAEDGNSADSGDQLSSFEELYVKENLVALFTVYGKNNDTVDLENGKWYARVWDESSASFVTSNTVYAEIKGNDFAQEADGALGIVTDSKTLADIKDSGIAFPDSLFVAGVDGVTNMTVQMDIVFRAPADAAAFGTHNGDLSAFRLHGMQATTFFGDEAGAVVNKWMLSFDTYAGHGLKGNNNKGNFAFAKAVSTAANNERQSFFMAGKFNNEKIAQYSYGVAFGDIGSETVATPRYAPKLNPANKTEAAANLSILNGTPGAIYTVLVYSTYDLSEAALKINHAANILQAKGDKYLDDFNGLTEIERNQMIETLSYYTVETMTDDMLERIFEDGGLLVSEEQRKTEYDKLYVGANGTLTANGAKLVALHTAYGKDNISVDLEKGIWYNKVTNSYDATFEGTEWKMDDAVGVGYYLTAGIATPVTTEAGATYYTYAGGNLSSHNLLRLNPALLGDQESNFTFEYTARYNEIFAELEDGSKITWAAYKADGTLTYDANGEMPAHAVGVLKDIAVRNVKSNFWGTTTPRYHRWYVNEGTKGWNTCGQKDNGLWGTPGRETDIGNTTAIMRATAGSLGGGNLTAAYSLALNGKPGQKSHTFSANAADYGSSNKYPNTTEGTEFYLFRALPATVYALRLYNGVLTETELLHNRAIDVLAYANADIATYHAMVAEYGATIDQRLAAITIVADVATVAASIEATYESARKAAESMKANDYDLLYVGMDGEPTANGGTLVGLFNAYGDAPSYDRATGAWYNKANTELSATVRGSGWVVPTSGGLSKDFTATEWNVGFAGISLPESFADLDNFYVDAIVTYRGLSDSSSNTYTGGSSSFRFDLIAATYFTGTGFRYYISNHAWGYHNGRTSNQNVYVFTGVWDNGNGKGAYVGNGSTAYKGQFVTQTFKKITTETEVQYGTYINGAAMDLGGAWFGASGAKEEDYPGVTEGALSLADYAATRAQSTSNASGRFSLMNNTPGTVYSVRVYTAPLTTGEQARNAVADRLYYYGIDLSKYVTLTGAAKEIIDAQVGSLAFGMDAAKTKADIEFQISTVEDLLAAKEAGSTQNDYDKLYVGADGSATANGGHLTALYTAFEKNPVSAAVQYSKWFNKMAGGPDADMMGGAYAEDNINGWKLGENGGFGYADTDFVASKTYLKLDKTLVAGEYDVDVVSKVTLREFDFLKETVAGEDMTATPNGDGTISYSHTFSTNWNMMAPIVYVVSGEPGTIFTPTYTYFYNNANNAQTIGQVTIGEDGTATIKATYRAKDPTIVLPETVTLVSATADVSTVHGEAAATTAFIFGSLHAMVWSNLNGSNTWGNGFGTTRWYVNPSAWTSTAIKWGDDGKLFAANNNKIATLSVVKDMDDSIGMTYYNVTNGGSLAFTTELASASVPAAYDFRMFHNLPAEIYAVRVYDAPLTAAERNLNHLIDYIAMAGIAPETITSLEETVLANVAAMMANTPITDDKADAEATLGAIVEILNRDPVDPADTFYVADGLVGLYTSYEALSSSISVSSNAITWVNLLKPTESATIYGKGWEVMENGGFRIQRTYDEWTKDSAFGIRFDYSQLPEDSYTVELTINPVGIHDYDEDGDLVRYRDGHTVYGTYKDYGYVLGPLRAMTYACFRASGDGMLEKRWVYIGSGCWNAWGGKYGYSAAFQDQTWQYLDVDQVTTYSITLEEEGDVNGAYTFYGDAKQIGGYIVPNSVVKEYIDYENCAEKRFELFNHVAGTVYAVRIYNRALTANEVAQNRVADIIYYYGLDTAMFEAAIGNMADTSSVYNALSILSFQMDREEAQKIFDAKLSAIWLTYAGVSARNDMNDGIRFYFDLNMQGVNNMLAANYKIEIGALVNVGRDKAPELKNNAYDYKLEAFNETAGCVQGFFVDEDTFCVTVNYSDAIRETYITEVYVRGYVHLITPDGSEMLFYAEPEIDGQTPVTSLFTAYENIITHTNLEEEDDALYEYLESVVDASFVDQVIWVDSSAVSGGDGKEETPYKTFAEALDAAKALMADIHLPTNVIVRLKDGKYPVYDVQEIAGTDMPYEYCYLTIEAENAGEATLTTTIELDSGEFVEDKTNIYKYQFKPDAEGNYPEFRYLYADGEIAQAAAQGDVYAANNNQTFTRYERTVDGIYEMVKSYYDLGMLDELVAECPYDDSRESILNTYNKYLQAFLAWDAYEKNPTGTKPVDPTTAAYKESIGATIMGEGKIYLPKSLIGGFEDYVAARRDAAIENGTFDESTFYRTVLADTGLLMHIVAQWDYNIMHIYGVDYDDYIIHSDSEELHYAVYMKIDEYKHYVIPTNYKFADRPVYLTDSYEFLDKEGEAYYDRVNGTVYYYTEGDIADVEFEYPTMDNLLVFDAVRDVTLWGLRLTGVDDNFMTDNGHAGGQSAQDGRFGGFPTRAAIYVKNGCKNMTIDSCVVTEVGCEGITMRGRIENLNVVYNEISGTGSAGLRVADNTSAFNDKFGLDNVTIMENYIHDIAYVYRNASALHLGSNRNLILANNTIHDTSYTAISIGWRWQTVGWPGEIVGTGEYVNIYNADIYGNYIYDFMTEMADGGAIYMLGGNASTEYREYINNIHDNYIVHTKDAGNGLGGMMCGIYFDGSCTNWYCSNNVVVEQSTGSGADDKGTPAYKRRANTYFIYIQHIDSQLTYNMLCENNIILNVRATTNDKPYNSTTSAQRYEVYRTYVVADRNIVERGTRYINGVRGLAPAIQAIITSAGCWAEYGDPDMLADDNY